MNSPIEEEGEMRDEYDFSHGIRGAFAERYRKGARVSVVEPDLAKVFPDSATVNKGLRILIRLDSQGLLNLEETLRES